MLHKRFHLIGNNGYKAMSMKKNQIVLLLGGATTGFLAILMLTISMMVEETPYLTWWGGLIFCVMAAITIASVVYAEKEHTEARKLGEGATDAET
jgi:peptidoglycan/LPS O-acetylase OafA/YrhL